MSGNVGEWCNDSFREYSDGDVTDPMSPTPYSVNVKGVTRGWFLGL